MEAASEPKLQPVVASVGGLATVKPAGKVSVSVLLRVVATVFGLFNLMCSVATPPGDIATGVNTLLKLGAELAETVKVAVAGDALLPCPVTSAPAGTVLVTIPSVDEVT